MTALVLAVIGLCILYTRLVLKYRREDKAMTIEEAMDEIEQVFEDNGFIMYEVKADDTAESIAQHFNLGNKANENSSHGEKR